MKPFLGRKFVLIARGTSLDVTCSCCVVFVTPGLHMKDRRILTTTFPPHHRSGYTPIATTSAQSAALAVEYGAAGTARYTSASCAETVRELARVPIRHTLDCITSPESVATSFAAMARTGGRYACLEALDDSWRTRRLIRVKEVMGFEGLGHDVRLGPAPSTYWRDRNPSLNAHCRRWRDEVQGLLDAGSLRHHPIREVPGAWGGIIEGLALLKNGQVRGQKLVVRLSSPA